MASISKILITDGTRRQETEVSFNIGVNSKRVASEYSIVIDKNGESFTVDGYSELEDGRIKFYALNERLEGNPDIRIRYEGELVTRLESVRPSDTFDGPFTGGPSTEAKKFDPGVNDNVFGDATSEPDARVYVNGVRIPTFTVDLQMRKEGALDLTRFAEVNFASTLDGTDFTQAFGSLRPSSQNKFDTLAVEIVDDVTGVYSLEFRGIVTGVGNGDSDLEREWECRAQGPGHFLDKFPVSKQFGTEDTFPKINDIIDFVIEELEVRVPLDFTSTPEEINEQFTEDDVVPEQDTGLVDVLIGGPILIPNNPLAPEGRKEARMDSTKTFQSNRHTMADILSWLASKIKAYIWFEPTNSGVILHVTNSPTSTGHTAHYLGGDLKLVENNALSELRPINTQVVKGKATASAGDSEYPVAKAVHGPLQERSGGVDLHADTEYIAEAKSKDDVESEARSRLKRVIDETTGGGMKSLPSSPIKPYDTIEAKPTCATEDIEGVESLTYEISRVHHKIRSHETSMTTLNVGVHTDAQEDIYIEDSYLKKV
jgi:hypothetical protein